ncbi:MAG: hypothetical protein U1E50_16890 [Caulobacteraceae bacterium]
MSSIWRSDNPISLPRPWISRAAGVILGAVAVLSLVLGFMTGWQKGESRDTVGGTIQSGPANVRDAVALPEVTLRPEDIPAPPKAAEAPKAEEDEEAPEEEEPPAAPEPTKIAPPPPKAAEPPPAVEPAPPPANTAPASPEVPF